MLKKSVKREKIISLLIVFDIQINKLEKGIGDKCIACIIQYHKM